MASAALLFANFVLIVAFEWNSALGGMSVLDRLHNAWFQSVTLRTAGFNSIAMDALRPVTLLVMMTSMFIGGSPGGTAGGIKTTTAAVMLLSVVAAIRGNKEIVMFGRRVSTETVDRAAAISTLGLLSLFSTVVVLLLTQAMPSLHAVFEAVSALATVGLSIGGTGELDSVGKVVITIAMFAGRVGPLSMFAFLATRERRRPLQPPVELIDVG
jgi:trk system potassium uptake protein TrkH